MKVIKLIMVQVPTFSQVAFPVPVPVPIVKKFQFRFHNAGKNHTFSTPVDIWPARSHEKVLNRSKTFFAV